MDLLSKGVGGFRGDRLLRGQPSDYLCPEASLSGLLEFVAYGVDYPVLKQRLRGDAYGVLPRLSSLLNFPVPFSL